MSPIGWVANALLVVGLWGVGDKDRRTILLTVVGELMWAYEGVVRDQYDLSFICVVFAGLALRNWVKWK